MFLTRRLSIALSFVHSIKGRLSNFARMITATFFLCRALMSASNHGIINAHYLSTNGTFMIPWIRIHLVTICYCMAFPILMEIRHPQISISVQIGLLSNGIMSAHLWRFSC